MKRRFCLSVLALFCSVLSGCDFFVTENSDPYTADEVAAMVNGKFHAYGAQVVPEGVQTLREKPFQRNRYALYDAGNGIRFTAAAYAEGYFAHLYPAVNAAAADVHLTAASPEEAAALRGNHVMHEGEPLFDQGDFIFLHEARGADAVDLCRALHALYRPQGDDTLLTEAHGRRITFCCLPEGTEEQARAVPIMTFYLRAGEDWAQTLYENPGHSSGEKDAALLEERLAQYFEVRLKAAKAHVRDYRK